VKPVKEVRVRDFMVTKPVVFTRETDLLDAVRVLVDRHISGAPVVDERGNLVGVLTERDFLKAARYPVMEDNRVVGVVARRDVLRAVIDAFAPSR